MIRAPKICGGSHIRAGLSGYVAELSSAMLGAELGLPVAHLDSHASYIEHWLELCSPRHNLANREVSIM
jgi:antirestriction protein ArdC